VTLEEGAEPPTRHELVEFARERIGYKAPEEAVFLDEMPVNPTGTLDRVGLRRWPRTTCTRTGSPPDPLA
jgi:acyl-CoA synthetase (AMP-forming)/AMP-acid ligase II